MAEPLIGTALAHRESGLDGPKLKAPSTARPPALLPQAEDAMAVELERLVRDKWHRLLEESGLHFEQGHVSPEVD